MNFRDKPAKINLTYLTQFNIAQKYLTYLTHLTKKVSAFCAILSAIKPISGLATPPSQAKITAAKNNSPNNYKYSENPGFRSIGSLYVI